MALTLLCLASFLALADQSAANGQRPPTSIQDRDLARQLVAGTLNHYRNYTRGAFTDGISEDFVPDRNGLIDGVERSFYAAKPVSIDFFIDQVTGEDGKLAVSFTWNKKVNVRGSGRQDRDRGQCLFVYKRSGNDWYLYSIKGKNPF